MKTKLTRLTLALALLALVTTNHQLSTAYAQIGTAFTYQGQLFDNGLAANGNYALQFKCYTGSNSVILVTNEILTLAPVTVSNGLFTVLLDFGPGVFNGQQCWLQIDAATNSGSPAYIPLTPRQLLTPAPYAIFANTASNLSGTLPTAQLSGTVNNSQLLNNSITVAAGAGLGGGGSVALGGSTSLTIPGGAVNNSMLANPSLTVSAGTGLAGGGTVALGTSTTLNNAGVLSVTGNADITATPTNGNVVLGDTATPSDTPNTILKRDGTGSFSAGIITGNGSGLTNVNAAILDGFTPASFWQITGNAGTTPGPNFLGTTDSQPLELHVNGLRGLRLSYVSLSEGLLEFDGSINVLAGCNSNQITGEVVGGTVAGGGDNYSDGLEIFSYPNIVTGSFGTVGGGHNNSADFEATVPGGYNNLAYGNGSFAAGRNAQTLYDGNFVWSDGSTTFNGTGTNRFEALATGGVNFYTAAGAPTLSVSQVAGHGGFVGVNTATPQQPLDVNGGFLQVQGGGAQAGIGGLSAYQGVVVGSFNASVTAVSFENLNTLLPMHINCSSITIQGGSDLAEPFQITDAGEQIPQGAVVVIDDSNPGHLKVSDQPYDMRVAGVVSGANGINPGIQMQQQGLLEGGKNVALTGRVYVQADASNGAIKPGDLLTTSATPGHAMKVNDHAKAQGAILGKAMTGLKDGKGMVLVLVTLQ